MKIMRRFMILALCMLIFTGCSNESETKEDNNVGEEATVNNNEKVEETEEVEEKDENQGKEDNEEKDNDGTGMEAFVNLMTESALKSKFGSIALENYFAIDDKIEYKDLTSDDENSKGSSFDEVKEAMDSVVDEEQYELVYNELGNDSLATFFYLDPESPLRSYDDMMNYADISFFFSGDELILSNIAPGLFSLDIERIHLKEEFEKDFTTITELENMEPEIQVFSLGKMKLTEEDVVYQIMVPTRETEEDSNIIANYIHLMNGKEVASIHKEFREVSQSFPSHSQMVLAEFLHSVFQP